MTTRLKAPTIDALVPARWSKTAFGSTLVDAAYRRGYTAGLSSCGESENPYARTGSNWMRTAKSAWADGFQAGSMRRYLGPIGART